MSYIDNALKYGIHIPEVLRFIEKEGGFEGGDHPVTGEYCALRKFDRGYIYYPVYLTVTNDRVDVISGNLEEEPHVESFEHGALSISSFHYAYTKAVEYLLSILH